MGRILEKHIEEALEIISGELGIKVYKCLKNKEDVNEFDIADKLKIEINPIRKVFYKFEKHNLVTSFRKKDRKKGWYLYFYTFQRKEAERLVLKLKRKTITLIENHIENCKTNEYYICINNTCQQKNRRYKIEDALEQNFICQECGEIQELQDNTKRVKKLSKEVKELKEEIGKLEK